MKQFALGLATAAAMVGVVAMSRSPSAALPDNSDPNVIKIESGEKNPWTSLKLNNDADQFQFAIVSDRTGGHRAKVFSQAVARVNLLQPQFVMSVSDLIEGYTLKEDTLKQEWDEFDGYVKRFEMPFFYVPGNHDMTNKTQVTKWGERYGKRYYSFTYKNCLFLCLCSENPPDMGTIDPEQQTWIAKTLEDNKNARWTFVFLHKPIWTAKDLEKNGWGPVEKMLTGRKYNVFCGHVHRYQPFDRNGTQYFQLATTGGGSRLRGLEYGEFDHVCWITMKKDAPVITQVMLDGILPADLKVPESDEEGVPVKRKPTHPVEGKLLVDGQPLAGATVTLYTYNPKSERYNSVCDGRTDANGRFQVTTYFRFDGAPAGEYTVTVIKRDKPAAPGAAAKNLLPEKYSTPATTPLKVTVKEGANDLSLELGAK
ncbi:MAG TPA: metallophosphoesterase [Gemmata sp.]|nr:metallophosphoesterase [Gemmata sp.]